jgi:hypothetical protein
MCLGSGFAGTGFSGTGIRRGGPVWVLPPSLRHWLTVGQQNRTAKSRCATHPTTKRLSASCMAS